ncbi:galactose oxidase-like domain-containing protein [Streptomyces sp. NPDC059918]|uniref:galactose oxidase-like domain-containing protein n=1 Tax=unclassified Streptomyces TaxID=2593676 RepID=UPI00364FBA26
MSHAEEHRRLNALVRAADGYSQARRTASLEALTESQKTGNAAFPAERFGRFTDYFQSPDFGVHAAQLPTGKVLLFSFLRVETDPRKETGPTNTVGAANAGRAFLWDPAAGTSAAAFKEVKPPNVLVSDGSGVARPAPFFCSGHAFLPNGMLAVFGGNIGGKGGTGAKFSFVFDPWKETWYRNKDMAVGRWYPTAAEGPDGRVLILSGQSEEGYGHPTPAVELFPEKARPVPQGTSEVPEGIAAQLLKSDGPYRNDYPHLFSLRDGRFYGLGRDADQQWAFDPVRETRSELPRRPGNWRGYGSAVPLPAGQRGPDSVLVMGGDAHDPGTFSFSAAGWRAEQPRAFGRTQDNTVLLPDGRMVTVNGSVDSRDYGNGAFNPEADLTFRQIETRDLDGHWTLGPSQRLPRGYHSNALLMPDGRVLVTGDDLQQVANDPDIADAMDGSIELYEPAYLHRGQRPELDTVPSGTVGYGTPFTAASSTADRITRVVAIAPSAVTHSVNTTQRYLELDIVSRTQTALTVQAPPTAADAPPGYYMVFALDSDGVPSRARWIRFGDKAPLDFLTSR